MTHSFSAVIRKAGINPYVDPPMRISKALAIHGYIPVRGTINGKRFVQTLVPLGGGKHRLFVNRGMLDAAKAEVGDRIEVTLRLDRSPPQVPMPPALEAAMGKRPTARQKWDELTPSRRKEIMRYLNSAKRPETLARNVARTIAMLEGQKTDRRLAAVRIPPTR